MMMVGEVFRGLDRFERMTEIYLDSEACNTLLKMSNSFNRSQDTLTVVYRHKQGTLTLIPWHKLLD